MEKKPTTRVVMLETKLNDEEKADRAGNNPVTSMVVHPEAYQFNLSTGPVHVTPGQPLTLTGPEADELEKLDAPAGHAWAKKATVIAVTTSPPA